MTTNQQRAVALAEAIRRGWLEPATLLDEDWNLLLLAAGLNRCQSSPRLVASRVLDRSRRRVGYFAAACPVLSRAGPGAGHGIGRGVCAGGAEEQSVSPGMGEVRCSRC